MFLFLPKAPDARINLLSVLTHYENFRDGNVYSRNEIQAIIVKAKKDKEEEQKIIREAIEKLEKNKELEIKDKLMGLPLVHFSLGIENPKALVYDAMNIGQPFACPVFESQGRGEYRYVGPNYKANCDVINFTKDGREKKVGEWRDGFFYVDDTDRLKEPRLYDKKLIENLKDGITWWQLFEIKTRDLKHIIETAPIRKTA